MATNVSVSSGSDNMTMVAASERPLPLDNYKMDFDAYDWRIFNEPIYYQWYGVWLPVIGTLGIVLNILSLVTFHQKDMRSLCTLFLKVKLHLT